MKLAEIIECLDCLILSGNIDPGMDVQYAVASDMMSDVLVLPKPGALLLTGLNSNQAVRTCKIATCSSVIFVRNKDPKKETLELAENYDIPLLKTSLSMFDACGRLYARGIRGIPAQKGGENG